MKSKQFETKASVIFSHIDAHLPAHRPAGTPLFVALQAPQGAGKTSLTARVREMLTEHNEDRGPYRVATLSIDDLFLPRAQMRAVAAAHLDNPLLCGRGFPGTHDMPLAISLLHSLKEINRPGSGEVHIPYFDKSLFIGEGDRVPESEWNTVKGPLDVVLLEGWMVGFYPQSHQYIEERMNQVPIGLDGILDFSVYTLEHVLDTNERLSEYIKLWDLFDICVQISPQPTTPYIHIYKWRLQQEHEMKAKKNGQGLTDEQLKKLVDRLIPGYHAFSCGVTTGGYDQRTGLRIIPPWLQDEPQPQGINYPPARCLRMTIDENRALTAIEYIQRQ